MLTRVWNSAAIVVKITRSPHTHSHEHTLAHTHTLSHSAMQPKLNRAENEMENIAMRKASK